MNARIDPETLVGVNAGGARLSVMVFMPALVVGGAEIAMVRLARAFAAEGHRVAIVVQIGGDTQRGDRPAPFDLTGIEIIGLGIGRTLATPPALARRAVAWGADAIVSALSHNNLAAVAAGVIVRRWHRRDIVVAVSEHAPVGQLIAANPGWRYRVLPVLQRLAYRHATAVVCASRGIEAGLRAILTPETPIVTVYNPVVDPCATETETGRNGVAPYLIVAAGRLAPEKDFATLIEAFVMLRQRFEARLVIAGDGSERESLRALAAQRGVADDVEIRGFTAALGTLLRWADAFVSTSRFEGFGNVIVEALAAGTPVVATDCPVGPREILADGRFGALVPVGDAAAIADALATALTTTPDRAMLRGRAGDFTVAASRAGYEAVIRAGMVPPDAPPFRPGGRRPLTLAIYMHDLSSGGVEHATLSLITAFRAVGIDVTLLLHAGTGELRRALPEGLRVVNFGTGRTIADLPKLVGYLRTNKPDILLANLDHNNLVAIVATRIARCGTRVIIAQHNALSQEARAMPGLKYRVLPWGYRILAPHADAVIAVSSGVADDLAEIAHLPRERITVINNPVVDTGFERRAGEAADHPWLSASAVPLFVTAGRLVAQKDHETLIRAFAQARQVRPMRLAILGEGPLRSELEALVATLGLGEDVIMPGYVANPLPWFGAAAAFVLSSRYEGFGNVIVEAMACGTPAISTDCPHGPAEILEDGRFGPLVGVGDVAGLASALDPELRRRFPAATLKARAGCYNLASAAAGYRLLFDRVINDEVRR